MKTILTILAIIVISLSIKAQEVVYTVNMASISGTDTTLYISAQNKDATYIGFEYSGLDANDGTVTLGYSDSKKLIKTDIIATGNPFTMVAATGSTTFDKSYWSAYYMTIKITKNAVTSGTVTIKIYK